MSEAKPAGRGQLIAMLFIVLGTLGGSYLLFYISTKIGPWNTVERGQFVEPIISFADIALTKTDGTPFQAKGLWWLLVVTPASCDSPCELALSQMRALQVLLTKDATRVRRALLAPATPASKMAVIAERYPKLEVLSATTSTLSTAEGSIENGIYLADPHGFLVLGYPLEEASGTKVKKDLVRLLKYSRSG